MARDPRLIQTAVLDNPDSEDPVECPTEAEELLIFRRDHLERSLWCGTWLGGCGGELITRLCEDKVCHFAHKADPDSPCRRKSSRTAGTGSADHLYIKAALTDWMASQNTPGKTHIPQDPSGLIRLGAQVTAEPTGHAPLHFILDETALPALDQNTADMVFGEHVEPPPRFLREHGFVHRVRCVSDGAHRRTQIGTQGTDGSTDWRDLTADHVRLTESGLSTEASAEIHRRRTQTVPIGSRHPRPPVSQTAPTRPAPSTAEPSLEPDRDELALALRTALAENAGVTQLQRHLDRLEGVVHSGATLVETELLRHAHEVLMRLRRGVGAPAPTPARRKRKAAPRSTISPMPLARPRASRAAQPSPVSEQSSRTSPNKPSVPAGVDVFVAVRKVRRILRKDSRTHGRTTVLDSAAARADFAAALDIAQDRLLLSEVNAAKAFLARSSAASQRGTGERTRLSPQVLDAAAVAVRGALKKAAREQRTTSWERLKDQLGSALPAMTDDDRTKVLILVDEASASTDQPLLTVLMAAGSPTLARSYQQVALSVGLALPDDDEVLADIIEADTEHALRYWKDR
ncbi:hypothetical protein ACH475_32050 [Streptomyces globisporus]|uniref:hypothetical protein n=1 Tax=Streptomyces globisporus TaxID=1908 RepID=UPI003787DE77